MRTWSLKIATVKLNTGRILSWIVFDRCDSADITLFNKVALMLAVIKSATNYLATTNLDTDYPASYLLIITNWATNDM